jgi:hypothetical protein
VAQAALVEEAPPLPPLVLYCNRVLIDAWNFRLSTSSQCRKGLVHTSFVYSYPQLLWLVIDGVWVMVV